MNAGSCTEIMLCQMVSPLILLTQSAIGLAQFSAEHFNLQTEVIITLMFRGRLEAPKDRSECFQIYQ